MTNITPNRPERYNATSSVVEELPAHVATPPATSQLLRYSNGTPKAAIIGTKLDAINLYRAAYGNSPNVQGFESHFRAFLAQENARPGDVIKLPPSVSAFAGKIHDDDLLEAATIQVAGELGRPLPVSMELQMAMRGIGANALLSPRGQAIATAYLEGKPSPAGGVRVGGQRPAAKAAPSAAPIRPTNKEPAKTWNEWTTRFIEQHQSALVGDLTKEKREHLIGAIRNDPSFAAFEKQIAVEMTKPSVKSAIESALDPTIGTAAERAQVNSNFYYVVTLLAGRSGKN